MKAATTGALVLVLSARTSTSRAERVGIDTGVGRSWFFAENAGADTASTAVSASLFFGGDIAPDVQVSARGHFVINGQDNLSAVGPDIRYKHGFFMAAASLDLVRLHGPFTADGRGDAIGVGMELRVGARINAITITANVFPVRVTENETTTPSAQLRGAAGLGLSVGCEL